MHGLEQLRYPIGRPVLPKGLLTADDRDTLIHAIVEAPSALCLAVDGLSEAQLNTPYRPGGWTVRQVVHHMPDSHINAYIRFKWALTEDNPVIKVYDEVAWSNLPDAKSAPVEISLQLLEAVHARWEQLLTGLTPKDFARTVVHPEDGLRSLDTFLAIYAWHGKHHVAHITTLRRHEGW